MMAVFRRAISRDVLRGVVGFAMRWEFEVRSTFLADFGLCADCGSSRGFCQSEDFQRPECGCSQAHVYSVWLYGFLYRYRLQILGRATLSCRGANHPSSTGDGLGRFSGTRGRIGAIFAPKLQVVNCQSGFFFGAPISKLLFPQKFDLDNFDVNFSLGHTHLSLCYVSSAVVCALVPGPHQTIFTSPSSQWSCSRAWPLPVLPAW